MTTCVCAPSVRNDLHRAFAGRAVGSEGNGEIVAVLVLARKRVAVARDLDALFRELACHPVAGLLGLGGGGYAELHRRLDISALVAGLDATHGDFAAAIKLDPIA